MKQLIKNKLKYILIILAILVSKNFYSQQVADTVYFNVNVSNYNPAVNEPVTISVEFELNRTYDACSLIFGAIGHTEYITVDLSWDGVIKAGEKFQKKYVVKFPEEEIANIQISLIDVAPPAKVAKLLTFHVGGAFEENRTVKILKRYIKDAKDSLNEKQDSSNRNKSGKNKLSGVYRPLVKPENIDSLLKAEDDINKKVNAFSNGRIPIPAEEKFDDELQKRNDSLEVVLRAENKKLYNQYKPAKKPEKVQQNGPKPKKRRPGQILSK